MGSCSLKYLGVSAFEITDTIGRKYYIDPCFENNPTPVISIDEIDHAEAVIVTHGASDHMGQAVDILKKTKATLFGPHDVCTHAISSGVAASRVRRMVTGARREMEGYSLKAVKAEHISFIHSFGTYLTGIPLGFIISITGAKSVYHAGDTAIFGDMKLIGKLYKPQIMLVPIGMFPGAMTEMDPEEASLAVSWVAPEIAIPMHFDPETQADFPVRFKHLVNKKSTRIKVVYLKAGDFMDISN